MTMFERNKALIQYLVGVIKCRWHVNCTYKFRPCQVFSMSRLLVHSVYPRGFSFLVFERAEAGVKQGEGCKKDLHKRHFLRGGASLLILAFCLSSLAILFRISLICRVLGEAEGTSQARRLCKGQLRDNCCQIIDKLWQEELREFG